MKKISLTLLIAGFAFSSVAHSKINNIKGCAQHYTTVMRALALDENPCGSRDADEDCASKLANITEYVAKIGSTNAITKTDCEYLDKLANP